MATHTREELAMRQALPLSMKIALTKTRIRDWVNYFGEDGVYISFSGGKDSTVLLDLVRNECGYSDVEAVFVDTGLEYPEIREFVKTFDNVTWLRPKKTFKQVVEQYGYPFISKEVSCTIYGAKKGQKTRIEKLNGTYKDKDGDISNFNYSKWKFVLNAPFEVSSMCCDVMKKSPTKAYEHKTHKHPMLGQMASESVKRTTAWLKTGCNAWDSNRPQSNPMAFWTEQDVLLYIKEKQLPICSVYGQVVVDDGYNDGQMCIGDYASEVGLFDLGNPPLKTTGCKRTGCMFCGYGCHLNNDQRFTLMRETHPKQYDYIMRPQEQGGMNYKEIIDWLNEHGNLSIKY